MQADNGGSTLGTVDLWQRLKAIRALRFEARSQTATGWNGDGSGLVTVEFEDSRSLIFTEGGTWRQQGGRSFQFSNRYRWSLLKPDRRIRLEHLRFSVDHPVYLFDLVQESEILWKSATPHICDEDSYTATLILTPGELQLWWRVEGTSKNEEIRYWYTSRL